MSNFITDCIKGKASIVNVNNYIDLWHSGCSKKLLHEFLGMTWEEYISFVNDQDYLNTIISNRKNNEKSN